MAWISEDRYLNQSEMENNADIIISYYRSQGIDDRTICAILGNMQAESTLSPVLTERGGGGGYGLVQWTPQSVLINHCSTLGFSPYTSGDVQIRVVLEEIDGISSVREWYTSQAFISNYYNSGATSDMINISGYDFLHNTMNWSPDKLAVLFMAGYERPSYNPSVNHVETRKSNAINWFNYMGGYFTPRLDDTGILGNFHYYSENPFYLSGYGMPNCTCYAWGRFWEIGDPTNTGENKPVNLPTGNGGEWWGDAVSDGFYETGQTPKLGAVACFYDSNGGAGHVAIVEEIDEYGNITCSNSAWQSTYFFITNLSASNNYNYTNHVFQGFIYNPHALSPSPEPTPTPTYKKHKFNFVLFNRRRRGF